MVLAEAGAAGLPLISTDVGAIAELVRDGETGRLIPPGTSTIWSTRSMASRAGIAVEVRTASAEPSSREITTQRRTPTGSSTILRRASNTDASMRRWRRYVDDAVAVAIAHVVSPGGQPSGTACAATWTSVVDAKRIIIIDDRVQFVSHVARIELGTGDKGRPPDRCPNTGELRMLDRDPGERHDRGTLSDRTYCMIIDSDFHDIDPEHRLERPRPRSITIGDNVWLGARVIVLPGVSIGENSVVGVGSVVTRDIPPGSLAVGVPARVVRSV